MSAADEPPSSTIGPVSTGPMPGEFRKQGHGNGCGHAVGPAHVAPDMPPPGRSQVSPSVEFDRLNTAIAQSVAALEEIILKADSASADILDLQVALLRDPVIGDRAAEHIGLGQSAALAWLTALQDYIAGFEQGGDLDIHARAAAVLDIRDRVLRILEGAPSADFPAGSIFVARNMPPSLFLAHDWSGGGGVVLEAGSIASHVALLARARHVPLVAGTGALGVSDGVRVLADGRSGIVIVDPQDADIEAIASAQADPPAGSDAIGPGEALHHGVEVLLNISDMSEIRDFDAEACDGIGLLRTEFLLSSASDLLREERQVALYSEVLHRAGGKPVTMRLFDLGGDKVLGGFGQEEGNSFLGMRGIRLLLAKPDILRLQARALLRAGATCPLSVLVPMVTVAAEIAQTRRIFEEEAEQLSRRDIASCMPQIGMMVEVPAAAIMLDRFSEADFFSLGTNDLAQYLMAASRDNAAVADLYRQATPALLRLIAETVATARQMGKPIGICGDLAGEPACLTDLMASGIRQISVAPARLAAVRTALMQARLDL